MIELENHLLGDGVLGRVAWPASRHAIVCRVPGRVIHTVYSVIRKMAVAVLWFAGVARRAATIEARLLSKMNEFILCKGKINPSFSSVGFVLAKDRVFCPFTKCFSGSRVAEIRLPAKLLRHAPTRLRGALLKATESYLFDRSAITFRKDEIVVPVIRGAAADFCDGHVPVLPPGIFVSSGLSDHVTNSKLLTLSNYSMRWNRAGGRELAGLTKRRQAEYRTCMNLPAAGEATADAVKPGGPQS